MRSVVEELGSLNPTSEDTEDEWYYLAQNLSPESAHVLATHNEQMRALVVRVKSLGRHTIDALSTDKDTDIRKHLAERPDLGIRIQGQLLRDEDDGVRATMAANSTIKPGLLVHATREKTLAASIASNRSAKAETLGQLAKIADAGVAAELAQNTSTPLDVLVELIGHRERRVRLRAAGNPATPVHALSAAASVATSGSPADRELLIQIARNQKSTGEVLGIVEKSARNLSDGYSDVLLAVANHPRLTQELVPRISADLRVARLAARRSRSVHLLTTLASSTGTGVRDLLAQNPACPERLLIDWARHDDGDPASADDTRLHQNVAQNPALTLSVVRALGSDPAAFRGVLRHRELAPDIIQYLADHGDARIRREIAGRRDTPVEILVSLAGDPNPRIRHQVAGNAGTPSETLVNMMEGSTLSIRRFLVSNPSTPPDVLVELAGTDDGIHLRALARNHSAPAAILSEVIVDSQWETRAVLAFHPNASFDLLLTLATDSVPEVRRRALSAMICRNWG